MNRDGFEVMFKKGIAIGQTDIQRDEITFRFRRELFTFPTFDAIPISRFNGYCYEAKIKDLRKLDKAKH